MKNIAGKIGKFLTEQKQHKQRAILFACLTVLVLYGTVTGLKLYGQAMNHRRDVLECRFEVHTHDKDCLNEDRELICGYADFVVHEHDELCYDWNGKLVCTLQEYELHEHDKNCYEEVRTLICEEESDAAAASANAGRELTCDKEEHTHGNSCYAGGEGCGKEAHTHSNACETRTLACNQNEHTHGPSCESSTLTCAEGEHTHGDGCYSEEGAVICGQNEHAHNGGCYTTQIVCGMSEHSHNDGCYKVEITCGKEAHEHDGSCGGDAELTCGKEEHVHGNDCWSNGGEGADGNAQTADGHVHTDDCYKIEEQLVCGKLELHEHDKAEKDNKCFDEDGNWICGVWELLEHQHDAGCLVTKELSPEEIADIGEQENHIHTEDCYEDGALACGHPAAHPHKDWCYDENGELICGYETEEHVHIDKCYDEDGELICGYEGARHLHDASCYDQYGELVCGYGSFYHEHEEDCYDEDGNLICGYLEEEHEHTEDCYDKDGNLICKYSDSHLHGPDCYDENGNLICGLTALKHKHTEDCYDADGNLICGYDEADIELRTEVGGITIILSGPPSSFDPDKEYTIEAELVWQEETLAVIDDAMAALEESFSDMTPKEEDLEDHDDGVESARKVQGYYAFDIRLLADGVEVEPLGPVSVRFEGGAVEEAANDEDTVSMVLHVDGETGDMTDMEAVEEDGAMAFETDHFSIYVYVNLQDILFGKIKLTVEHWGKDITTVDGTAVATGSDTAFQTGATPGVKTKAINCKIYSTDELEVPNEYYTDVRTLSKLYNAQNGQSEENAGDTAPTSDLNYEMLEFWVSTNLENKDKPENEWDDFTVYQFDEDGDKFLRMTDKDAEDGDVVVEWEGDTLTGRECIIRFWYKPIKEDNQFPTPAVFYDYDITNGSSNVVKYGSAKTEGRFNFRQSPSTDGTLITPMPSTGVWVPILGQSGSWYKINYKGTIGWMSSGGLTVEKTYANQNYILSEAQGINGDTNFTTTSTNNRMGVGQQSSGNLSSWATTAAGTNGRFLNKFNSGQNAVVKGIVTDTLVNEKPQFTVNVPKGGFFDTQAAGITAYGNYQLRFKQDGDTYTLQNVYNTTSGKTVTGDLTQFSRYNSFNSSYPSGLTMSGTWNTPVYSNDFWPMDDVQGIDPHMGASLKQYRFLYKNGSELQKIDAPNPSDDNLLHNWHFGMEYKVEFTVGDYTGPMEYYFRGDDDLWLYIDNKLAVDIGGIHSSAGETLDIRQWMEENGMLTDTNKKETHYMRIFYMERGGFGSCCYMQFTLPNSAPVEVDAPETTYFEAHKEWDDGTAEFAAFRPTSIRVELTQILNGVETPTGVFADLNKDNNWTCSWSGLPKINGASQGEYSYSYVIREVEIPGYTPELKNNGTVLVNHLESTSVAVRKVWDGDEGTSYRPENAMFQLYYRAEGSEEFIPYKDIKGHTKELTLDESNGWSGTFNNLPKFTDYKETLDTQGHPSYTASAIEYMVYEVHEDEEGNLVPYLEGEGDLADGKDGAKYEVSYESVKAPDQDTNAAVTVTNRLVSKTKIVKKGAAPDGSESNEPVAGAVFKLDPYSVEGVEGGTDASGKTYIGIAEADGTIMWTEGDVGADGTIPPKGEAATAYVPDGTWLLSEIKAPVNFGLNEEKWIVVVGSGEDLPSVHKADGNAKVDLEATEVLEDGTAVLSFYYYDYLTLYELPETGGMGIAWYAFAGILAVLASLACFTYKKRRTEC